MLQASDEIMEFIFCLHATRWCPFAFCMEYGARWNCFTHMNFESGCSCCMHPDEKGMTLYQIYRANVLNISIWFAFACCQMKSIWCLHATRWSPYAFCMQPCEMAPGMKWSRGALQSKLYYMKKFPDEIPKKNFMDPGSLRSTFL